ncbi:MAG: hypothetical protein ABDH66_03950 [Bacteroidia bacterium]
MKVIVTGKVRIIIRNGVEIFKVFGTSGCIKARMLRTINASNIGREYLSPYPFHEIWEDGYESEL